MTQQLVVIRTQPEAERVVAPALTRATVVVAGEQPTQVIATAGAQGPSGPPGPAGRAEQFVHTQEIPSALWHILHNRGVKPLVSVRDVNGSEVIASVRHVDGTQLYIEFSTPFVGTAVLV